MQSKSKKIIYPKVSSRTMTIVVQLFLASTLNCFLYFDASAIERLYQLSMRQTAVIEYDAFSGQAGIDNLRLELTPLSPDINTQENLDSTPENQNTENTRPTQLVLKISPVSRSQFQLSNKTGNLPLNISSTDNSAFHFNNEEFQNPLSASQKPQTLVYQFLVPELQYADAGNYTIDVDIVLIDGTTQQEISNKLTTQIRAEVLPKLQTNLAGSRGRFEDGRSFAVIDFGEVSTGESQRIFIQVRGNTLARINLKSENGGKMIHQKHRQSFIDYSVTVDGEFSDLSAPLVVSRTPARNLNGSAYPMIVTLGDVSSKFAGVYNDIINIDVKMQ